MDECLILTEKINVDSKNKTRVYPYCQITKEKQVDQYCAGFMDGTNIYFKWDGKTSENLISNAVINILRAYDVKNPY